MSKKVTLKLLPSGEIYVETHGIKGKKCLDYINKISNIIGGRTIKSEKTHEYYEEEEFISDFNKIQNNIQIDNE